jgi:hypothetical protein
MGMGIRVLQGGSRWSCWGLMPTRSIRMGVPYVAESHYPFVDGWSADSTNHSEVGYDLLFNFLSGSFSLLGALKKLPRAWPQVGAGVRVLIRTALVGSTRRGVSNSTNDSGLPTSFAASASSAAPAYTSTATILLLKSAHLREHTLPKLGFFNLTLLTR